MPRRQPRKIAAAPQRLSVALPQRGPLPVGLRPATLPAVPAVDVVPAVPLPVVAAVPIPVARAANALVLRGDYWEVAYDGRAGMVEDCRGLRYIAVLVSETGGDKGPLHAKELVARVTGQQASVELETKDYILDSAAETQLIKRVEEIGFERTRAAAANDYDRMAALEEEYDRIAEELSRGRRGAAGRRGIFGDGGEKARKAVSKAITEAIAKIGANPDLAPLAQHFATTIRKGQWLSYTGGIPWQIQLPGPLPRK